MFSKNPSMPWATVSRAAPWVGSFDSQAGGKGREVGFLLLLGADRLAQAAFYWVVDPALPFPPKKIEFPVTVVLQVQPFIPRLAPGNLDGHIRPRTVSLLDLLNDRNPEICHVPS
jgi:hypothetical protein